VCPQDAKPSTRPRGRDFWRVVRRPLRPDYLPNRRGWRHGQGCGRRRRRARGAGRRAAPPTPPLPAQETPAAADGRRRPARHRQSQQSHGQHRFPIDSGGHASRPWRRPGHAAVVSREGAAGTVMEKLPTWLPRRERGRLWSLERHYLTGCAAGSSFRELLQGAPGWVRGAAASPSPEPRPAVGEWASGRASYRRDRVRTPIRCPRPRLTTRLSTCKLSTTYEEREERSLRAWTAGACAPSSAPRRPSRS
jgi:hypothetical protein